MAALTAIPEAALSKVGLARRGPRRIDSTGVIAGRRSQLKEQRRQVGTGVHPHVIEQLFAQWAVLLKASLQENATGCAEVF